MKSDNELPQNTRISKYSFKTCMNNIVIGVVDLSFQCINRFLLCQA